MVGHIVDLWVNNTQLTNQAASLPFASKTFQLKTYLNGDVGCTRVKYSLISNCVV